MSRRFQKVMALAFVVYIGGFFALQFIVKERDFSELENRKLASAPKWSMAHFLSGGYGEDFETYIADQFPGRDSFIAVKSNAERLLQKKDNNGVYIGKEGYFLQTFNDPDQELLEKNIHYINRFAEHFNTTMMLVPTATKVHEDRLPAFATPYDEGVFIETLKKGIGENVNWLDMLEVMGGHKEEDIYYKTDHHWTTLGAYYGYEALCKSLGIEPLALDRFNRIKASETFYGTLFSKGNFTFAKPDTLEIFEPKNPVDVKVHYVMEDETKDTLYDKSHLEKKDKYSVFLGGNHAHVKINTNTSNGKKIAIVKDSYANAFIPFLSHHFEEIHVFDLRFFSVPIADYLREEGIEDVLLLYNAQNFATMNKLSLLGK